MIWNKNALSSVFGDALKMEVFMVQLPLLVMRRCMRQINFILQVTDSYYYYNCALSYAERPDYLPDCIVIVYGGIISAEGIDNCAVLSKGI